MLTWGSFQFVLENFYIVEFINFTLIFKAVNIKYIMMFCPLVFPRAPLNCQMDENLLGGYKTCFVIWMD